MLKNPAVQTDACKAGMEIVLLDVTWVGLCRRRNRLALPRSAVAFSKRGADAQVGGPVHDMLEIGLQW